MTRIFQLFVFSFSILSSCGRKHEPSLREDCWDSYVAIKLCLPVYEKCLISMDMNCSEVFLNCASIHTASTNTSACREHIQNYTEILAKNEKMYVVDLFERIHPPDLETVGNARMCNVSIFKHHNFNASSHAMTQVEMYPRLIFTYCQCPELQGTNSLSSVSPPQSRLSKTPIHFWYGGLQNYKCWKEVDRYMVETLCGKATAILINYEWAKWADCEEDPTRINCSLKFAERLQEVSINSEKRLFCSVYVEIFQKLIIFFNFTTFDYKIVYVENDEVEHMNYRDDELYLSNPTNADVELNCFSSKRSFNLCSYSFHSCKKFAGNECDEHFITCIKSENALSNACISMLIPQKSNAHFAKRLLISLWEHKVQIFFLILAGLVISCSKKLRDWIVKELGIKTCTSLTKLFDAAIIYFHSLVPKNEHCQDPEVETINRENTEEENNEGNGTWSAVDQLSLSLESTDRNCNDGPSLDNDVGYIEQEPPIINNESPFDPLLNSEFTESIKKEEASVPKEKPKLKSAFTSMCRSFSDMSRSMGNVLYVSCIFPAFDHIRQRAFRFGNRTENSSANELREIL